MQPLFEAIESWVPPEIADLTAIPHGDMPGDRVSIHPEQVKKAGVLFPVLVKELRKVMSASPKHRAVVAICGGSGSGKSGMASLMAHYLRQAGVGTYVLSGDNYPRRIPAQNDAERFRVFRCGGIRGLLTSGLYSDSVQQALTSLQEQERDSDPALCEEYPWLETYQKAGRSALAGYLGTNQEQDFDELTGIVSQFKNGAESIWLKRMGRTELALWYERVDFSQTDVLIIEWTHANSDGYQGADIPILMNSTPQETLEYRRSRNRDGGTDSPFVTMVLEIEQRLLDSQAHKAKIILSKKGELLTYEQYRQLMAQP